MKYTIDDNQTFTKKISWSEQEETSSRPSKIHAPKVISEIEKTGLLVNKQESYQHTWPHTYPIDYVFDGRTPLKYFIKTENIDISFEIKVKKELVRKLGVPYDVYDVYKTFDVQYTGKTSEKNQIEVIENQIGKIKQNIEKLCKTEIAKIKTKKIFY